jgi:myo-inositol-1(or 4)-monophosphatase
MTIDTTELLERINGALDAAAEVFETFDPTSVAEERKSGGDPVTEADLEIDRVLKNMLRRSGEGWLSEETADDLSRLDRDLVWIVDPLDGTKEFVEGLPEFCTSISAVLGGVAVAGGVLNPAADFRAIGALDRGVTYNGHPRAGDHPKTSLTDMVVLASRSEIARGEWKQIEGAGIAVRPMGSVAYKMARVAVGLEDATWTVAPKHEWDVAGGAALLNAVGGSVVGLDGSPLVLNREVPWISGAIAVPPGFEALLPDVLALVEKQV